MSIALAGDGNLLYLFEDYSLDPDRRELRRGNGLLAVEPKVFDLLVHLISNRHRVVSKDDLIATLWGGRIVSESALTTCINAARSAIGDNGETQRLIKTLPRKGIRFVGKILEGEVSGDAATARAPVVPRPLLALPDKPSIAILPFANLSNDPEQEYFADGVVEDITVGLSRMRWLLVIARNSSFTYKGRAVDVKRVGRELGVRYVLEGSVRKAVNRVRITAQLIDTSTGAHLWADRFDGGLEDIFELQDRVSNSVVGAIAPKLEQSEIERAKSKPTENLDAYDYLLRGKANVYLWTRESISEALRLFYRAIELDPDFGTAYGMAAWCYTRRKASGWVANSMEETAETARVARRAVELAKDDAVALCTAGFALARVVGDLDDGAVFIDRARDLNPNLAAAWLTSGWVRVYLGEPDVAVSHLMHASRLSPLDPLMFGMHAGMAFAHFFAGRYDEAAAWAEKALREQPTWVPALRTAAASHALAGRQGNAQHAMARMRQLAPEIRLSNLKGLMPLRRPEDLARFAEGLRKAGLPE